MSKLSDYRIFSVLISRLNIELLRRRKYLKKKKILKVFNKKIYNKIYFNYYPLVDFFRLNSNIQEFRFELSRAVQEIFPKIFENNTMAHK